MGMKSSRLNFKARKRFIDCNIAVRSIDRTEKSLLVCLRNRTLPRLAYHSQSLSGMMCRHRTSLRAVVHESPKLGFEQERELAYERRPRF